MDYQYGTPKWRTELYDTCGTVQTLDSYITLVESLPSRRNYIPELKTPPDIFQWVKEFLEFAKQAVYLDEDGDTAATLITATARIGSLKTKGVNIISPPFAYLLTTTADNKTIIPSTYAIEAKKLGLDIVPWKFERSGPLANVAAADKEYYYAQIAQGIHSDGQMFEVLDV
jgi:glycerophosphoryl diester phosphodiesterase